MTISTEVDFGNLRNDQELEIKAIIAIVQLYIAIIDFWSYKNLIKAWKEFIAIDCFPHYGKYGNEYLLWACV